MVVVAVSTLSALLAAAAPPHGGPPPGGLVAATPLDEVKALDAHLVDTLKGGPALEALLTTEDEMKAVLKKMGVAPADMAVILETARNERVPASDLPQSLAATMALVEVGAKPGTTHTVRLFDASGYRLTYDLYPRKKGVWALSGAPRGEERVMADELEIEHAQHVERGTPLPLYFTKSDTGWTKAAMPPPDAERCRALMHARAKEIHAAMLEVRAEQKRFPGGEPITRFGDGFLGWIRIEPVDAEHYKAEVNRHGGKVTINETGVVTDVTPCALSPGARKTKKK